MQIKQNPFVSDVFTSKWLKQFNAQNPVFEFKFINGLEFFKPTFMPIYINVGQNITKGISYTLSNSRANTFKNSIAHIYDVPDYVTINSNEIPPNIKLNRVKQYPGYLIDLTKYQDLNNYLQSVFSKKRRDKIKRYTKRLELCFDISYQMFYGEISEEEFDKIFIIFKKLLEKRFTKKQITNNNLDPKEWAFYTSVAFPMILEKKASLFVVYERDYPIAITLNYHSENILFHGITVFDIDFSKFHLGKVALLNLLSWCFQNKINILDFSKGHFEYKTRWMTKAYNFEYHVYYDATSLKSKIIAFLISSYLKIKQFLREKEVNKRLHQLTFWFKSNSKQSQIKFKFSELSKDLKESDLLKIDNSMSEQIALKTAVNEFLFLNSEKLKDLTILKVKRDTSTYLLKGKKNSKLVLIT